ncbi:MAG: PIG-L family deacetylase [Thermoguttaceae bacterium]|nr:PIG-L family deacetylase [Thermoguttaceae bacterium]MBQ3332186.1 PIG-L family deacetylase [Thermoguttaceae bacterium]MBQ6620298.1 PIG-L family deacetylase [Thermoguttaceae bacterium]MBR2585615.1 PIG-L family deacetylase [Thermoguttaceae bacterium]
MTIYFDRRTDQGTVSSDRPEDIFPEWKFGEERWLFLSPHDDDIVCGCGLTFIAALEMGVQTFTGVVTNGRMGYCRPEVKETIADVRKKECTDSFRALGLDVENNLFFLNHDDGSLNIQAGRRLAQPGDTAVIAGGTGVTNSLTWLLRKTRPNRLFVPTITDLHPDHKFTNSEAMISIFHAQGGIWPELGEPIAEIPRLYEYAAYSNFLTPPTLRLRVPEEMLQRKLDGIYAYKSQEQIDLTIKMVKRAGTNEYLREVRFDLYDPEECRKLFDE